MELIGVVAGKSGEAITKEVKKWGVGVALVMGKENEPGYDIADIRFCSDLSKTAQILNFFQEHNVTKVIFGTGHIFAIELAEVLANNGILINIIPEVSLLCNNKYQLKKKAEEIGLKTPKYCIIDKFSDLDQILNEWNFPLVVKSIRDYVAPQLVHDKLELKNILLELFEKEPTAMLEQYIRGNDCSVVVSNSGEEVVPLNVLYWSKAHEDKLKGFFESYSKPLPKETEDIVKSVAADLIKYVNVLGLPRVDIIVENGIPYILEINSIIFSSNSGSWYTVSSRIKGINSPKIIVDNAMKGFMHKTGQTYSRHNEVLIFTDDVTKKINLEKGEMCKYVEKIYGVQENYLFEDTITKIKEYAYEKFSDAFLSERIINDLLEYVAFINIENPDRIENFYTGDKKVVLDSAIEFLNRNKNFNSIGE